MHFIEHIIEPERLYLTWQSRSEQHRTRFIVGELRKDADGEITLRYFTDTKDFEDAKKLGFCGYPAFRALDKVHGNVLDSFLRRLPPRTRGDFSEYLEGFRLHPQAQLSDFALLGYSGAKLLSDGFSLIHPFENVAGPCELLLDVAGFRHYSTRLKKELHIEQKIMFSVEFNEAVKEKAVRLLYEDETVGYVNRGIKNTFIDWHENGRIEDAVIEKINGTTERPALYLFVRIKSAA